MLRICNQHDCHTKTLGSYCINHETIASRGDAEASDGRSAESSDSHEPVAID